MRNKLSIAITVAGAIIGQIAPAVFADEEYVHIRRTTVTETTPAETTPAEQTTIIERRSVVPAAPVPATTTVVPGTVVPSRVVAVEQTITPLAATDAQLILQTVEERRLLLDKSITEALAGGTITETQVVEYRHELGRIGNEIVVLKSTATPSLTRSIVLGQDLDVLALRMKPTITTVVYAPIIEGSHFTIINGRIIQLDEPAVRRLHLEEKILDKMAQGKITVRESDILRSDLNNIAATEDAYRVKGPLTDHEARLIYKAMDKVAIQLERFEEH